jgi:Fe2+ transport system protein FeoA
MEIGMIVTHSSHLPASCSGSATLEGMNCKDEGAMLKLSDAGRGTYTIEFVTSRERQTINRLCSLELIPGLEMKVLRAIPKGPIVIEMKDTQIALGREVAESILVSSKEEVVPPRIAATAKSYTARINAT